MADRVVTREQAAKRLRCSMRTVERMLRDGRLGAVRREDGRLSVDPEDLARVLADPGLLERRRSAATPDTAIAILAADRELPPKATAPSQTRLTPLDGVGEPAPVEPPARPGGSARRARRSRVVPALIVATLVLAGTIAVMSLVDSSSDGGRDQKTTPRTSAPAVATISGGRAATKSAPGSGAASRGGRSTTVVVRAARPQTRRPRVTEPAPPPTTHSRASAGSGVTNCGFGSLTMAAC